MTGSHEARGSIPLSSTTLDETGSYAARLYFVPILREMALKIWPGNIPPIKSSTASIMDGLVKVASRTTPSDIELLRCRHS
jgi:hypothetical protein